VLTFFYVILKEGNEIGPEFYRLESAEIQKILSWAQDVGTEDRK
jgi:hypothetical protein